MKTFYCLFILYFANLKVCMSRTYSDDRTVWRDGCKYTLDTQRCHIEIYCVFKLYFDPNIFTNYDGCESDGIYYNGEYYKPRALIFKNIMGPDLSFSNYHARDIVSIDISENNYETLPTIRQLESLKFLNISNNNLTSAVLYNENELKSLEGIDFSHNNICDIVTNSNGNAYVFNTLINLTLAYNKIRKVKDNLFMDFHNLRRLDISHNHIASIGSHTFEGCTQLSVLQLSHNNIIDVNFSLIRFTELEELYLNNNNIQKILFNNFQNLHNLKILDLSYNSIVLIEDNALQNILLLKKIDLSNNILTNISKSFFSKNLLLNDVNLSHNSLTELPQGLFKGKNISMFSIEENYLGGIVKQGMFEGLKLNKVLNLRNQALKRIEQYAFFGLEKLTDLLLSSNTIESVSNTSFRTLINLKILDMTNNRITHINFDKEDLRSLKILLLRSNFIMEINSNQLESLHALEILDLSYNNISKIERKSFTKLLNINSFQISKNSLVGKLESGIFEGLILVPTLDLSYTSLDAVQNNSFDGMINLIELNISYSKINEVQYNAFFNTGDIKILDLSNNEIKSFCVNTTDLRNLNQLSLDNNLIKSLGSDFVKGMIYLNKITICNNKIVDISDDTFNDQKDLSYLDISNNINLYCDFSVLKKAKHLYTLILSNTVSNISFSEYKDVPITELEVQYSNISNLVNLNLSRLVKISFLRLSHNSLSQLEMGSFSNLSDVSEIDISFNKISVIQVGVFKDNPLLTKLNISHNELLEIGYGTFRGLINLKILDVSFNFINSLESESFYEVDRLTVLIIDHNKITNVSLEALRSTNISVLSIGDNPISCKALSNLVKYKHSTLSITAMRHVDTVEHNSYGITCDINNHKSELSSTPRSGNYNENTLLNIRDILSDMNLKKLLINNHQDKTANITRLEILQENSIKEVVQLQNYVSTIHNESVATNKLLDRILKVIVATSSTDGQLQYKNNTTSDNILSHISQFRKDIINEMTIEKEKILAEVDNKLSMLYKSFDTLTTTATATVPLLQSESLSSTAIETRSPIFVETCVALILIILVCIVLRKIYKSKIYILRRRSVSTRQISDSMETSNV